MVIDAFELYFCVTKQVNIFSLLSARDCLYLGKHSFNNGYYGQAVKWFEQALQKSYKEGNRTASADEIIAFYKMALEIVS